MSYYRRWACPGKGALNQSSTVRPTISTSWELERGMGLLSCGLGPGVGVRGRSEKVELLWWNGVVGREINPCKGSHCEGDCHLGRAG